MYRLTNQWSELVQTSVALGALLISDLLHWVGSEPPRPEASLAGADAMAMYSAKERLGGATAGLGMLAAASVQTGGCRFVDAMHESGGVEVPAPASPVWCPTHPENDPLSTASSIG